MSAGDKAAAGAAYDKVFAANISPISRQAAFMGKIGTGSDPQGLILKTLAGPELLLYAPALAKAPDYFGAADIGRVADLMGRLPEEARIQMVAMLAKFPPETVRTYLLTAAESPSLNVRLAALRAIDGAMEEAALNLGARGWRLFARVVFPQAEEDLLPFVGSVVRAVVFGLIGTALTPRIPVPWYNQTKVLESLAGQGEIRVSTQTIKVTLPDEANKSWAGIIWLLVASFPAALGGGVLHPAVNSLITKSSDKSEVGGMLGISAAFYSAANAIAPLFYGSLFQWLGAPVPFFAGGLILLVLWFLAPRAIPK